MLEPWVAEPPVVEPRVVEPAAGMATWRDSCDWIPGAIGAVFCLNGAGRMLTTVSALRKTTWSASIEMISQRGPSPARIRSPTKLGLPLMIAHAFPPNLAIPESSKPDLIFSGSGPTGLVTATNLPVSGSTSLVSSTTNTRRNGSTMSAKGLGASKSAGFHRTDFALTTLSPRSSPLDGGQPK